jgi:hypothetical protein
MVLVFAGSCVNFLVFFHCSQFVALTIYFFCTRIGG